MPHLRRLAIGNGQAPEPDPSIVEVHAMIALTERGEIKWTSRDPETFEGVRDVRVPGGATFQERYWVGEFVEGMWMTREVQRGEPDQRPKFTTRPGPRNRTGTRADRRQVQSTLRRFATRLDAITRQAPIPLTRATTVSQA